MQRREASSAILIVAGLLLPTQGCHLGPLPSVPDLSGTYISHSASIQADQKTAEEILSTFKRAEEGLQRRDLDAIMALYADNYKHHGFTKDTLRAEWKHLLEGYRDFSTTHVLTRIEVESGKTPLTARITCTGSLWAISNESGQRVNIDSWFGEVHYLIYDRGSWLMQGHGWEVLNPKETRFARPPHPFF